MGALLLLLPATGSPAAPGADGLAEVQGCLERNVPATTSEQMVEFAAFDRIGGERVSRAKVKGKRFEDGRRRLAMRFTQPVEIRGAALLVTETEVGANETYVYTPELAKVKRITAAGAGGTLFGTDFSYEDFERWQLLNKPGRQRRLQDGAVAGRSVYVVETEPDTESGSAYESVVSYVDQRTCVVLKTESFETGGLLRKVLTAKPESIIEDGGVHVASELALEDRRDETHTRVTIEDLEVDREIDDREFSIGWLSRRH